jgi:hypothetical protein
MVNSRKAKNPVMNTARPAFSLLALLLVVACSSPESRIQASAAAFNAWPADVQQKVKAGQVDVGFTEEMVVVALGGPDGKSTRTAAEGTSEVWTYLDHGPRFSIGVGMGSARGGTVYGGAVAVGDDGFRAEEKMRVIFNGGRVTAIERRKK